MKVFFDSQFTVPKPLRIPYFVLESILWSPLEGSLDALVVPEALEHGLEGGEGEVGEAGGAIVQQELGEEGERPYFGHVHWTLSRVATSCPTFMLCARTPSFPPSKADGKINLECDHIIYVARP